MRKKIVEQFDRLGNLINEYGSVTEASKMTGVKQSHISNCCNNKKYRKTAGGYIWKYWKSETEKYFKERE